MMFTGMSNRSMMNCGASAPCANASSCCAQTATMQPASMIMILDAIIMASIIFTLITILSISLITILALVSLLVLIMVKVNIYTPRKRSLHN